MLKTMLEENNMTVSALSKKSGVPYSTLSDLVSEKTDIRKCSFDTICRIAKALSVSVNDLADMTEPRDSFENFKSNICHELKLLGDIGFIVKYLKNNDVFNFYKRKWMPECLYLLSMIDYVSRINNIPLAKEYRHIRTLRLKDILYPESIIIASEILKSNKPKEIAVKDCIPEFRRHNIIENEVRNVY